MQTKLMSIAAAVALALASTAQAQTRNDTDKPRTNAAETRSEVKEVNKVDRKTKHAEEERIEADAKAAKARCEPMKGNEKDICQAEAKAKEKVAKAELEQRFEPSARHARKVEETKAEGQYEVAKEKCESNKDGATSCKKEAKANYERAKADIKAKHAKADAKRERTAGTGASGDNTPNRDLNRNGR